MVLPTALKLTLIRRGSLSYSSVLQWDLDNNWGKRTTDDDDVQENVADDYRDPAPKRWRGDRAMGGLDCPGDEGSQI